MKFAEHLGAHITPEWRKQYIKYEEMKAMLYNAIEQAPSAEDADPDEILKRYLTKFDEQFFRFCYKELEKINTFFSEKLAEATRKYANLNSELREALEDARGAKDGFWSNGKRKLLYKRNLPAKKIQELKLAFSEFYLSLVLLQNYQNLNFTGFRKILKKHDKLLSVNTGLQWHEEHVELSHFHVNKDISRLIVETESAVTRELEGGDRARAMKRLRVPPLGEQQNIWTTFKVGFFAGALVVLSVAVIISGLFHHRRDDWRIVFRLYRGPLLIVEFLFLWSINVYGWRSSGVNHVLIFELNPRSHLSEQHIMELAAVFGVVWALSVLSFLYSPALGVPAYVNPLILHILMLAFLINPFKVFRHEARFWALRVLGRIFLSPFFYVSFADFFVADQLNSLAPVFLDLQYFFCFYAKIDNWCESEDAQICMKNSYLLRPIMATLPSWFRLAQCLRRYRDTREAFPHLLNAAKYATTFFVIIFATLSMKYEESNPEITENPWFYAWLSASVISSGCTYVWDIKMDWGLFDSKAGDNKFLREEIVYSSTWFYYFAIVEDLILRFGWALSLSLTEMGYIHADLMVSILAPLEVFRRFVWNFFRLENEHLNNCGKFRAVRDISVAPMDSSDQTTILGMMDNEDGVMNRNISKPTTKKQRQPFRVLLSVDSVDDLDN